jgi:hypothetical protein
MRFRAMKSKELDSYATTDALLICWAGSSVPPFCRQVVIPVARKYGSRWNSDCVRCQAVPTLPEVVTAPPARGGKRVGQIRLNSAEFRIPRRLMSNHSVEHDEQLAHGRGQRHLRFLAGGTQTKIKHPQHRVASGCYRAHVKHRAHLGATAPNRARPAHLATVAVERCESHHQDGDLAAAEALRSACD